MNEKLLIKQAEKTIQAKFAYLAHAIHSIEVMTHLGPTLINSHLLTDMFNIIFCEGTVNTKQISDAVHYFRERNLPAAWWVGFQSDPDNLKQQLEWLYCRNEESELLMFAPLSEIKNTHSTKLIIKQVRDSNSLKVFAQVIGSLLPEEAKAISDYYEMGAPILLQSHARLTLFVGYIDDQPIATSSLFLFGKVAGIFDVMTLPDARGQGIGSAMTIEAMKAAKYQGYDVAILTATNNAKFLYEKLGFNRLSEMCVYPIQPR